MEGHSGQKCNVIATCIPLDRIRAPLDRTFLPLDRTFIPLDRTFIPLDRTFLSFDRLRSYFHSIGSYLSSIRSYLNYFVASYITYGLLTKSEVKMAGYWPSSFFACL